MALLSKEMRECSLYAGLALIAQVHCLGSGMGLPLIPFLSSGRDGEIPFLSIQGERELMFTSIAIIVAIILGLHQTLWESWRQTTLFLLHRPMLRSQVFVTKMIAGILLVFCVTALPLFVYALWAAKPGTHASPFFWSMTDPWWRSVAIAMLCYLGAFLTGLRPANWIGSRVFPLIAALVISIGLKYVPVWMSFNYLGFAILAVCLVISIIDVAKYREFP